MRGDVTWLRKDAWRCTRDAVGLVEGTWRQHRLRKVHGKKDGTGQRSSWREFFPPASSLPFPTSGKCLLLGRERRDYEPGWEIVMGH